MLTIEVNDRLVLDALQDIMHRVRDGANTMIYIKYEQTDISGGIVIVVKTTMTGQGTFVTSIRRLSRDEANKDRVIGRLLKKGN